jgi:chemotaxis signal transduction protein
MSDALSSLRKAFDASFASRPQPPPPHQGMVALTAGGQPCLLPLSDVAGLHAHRRIVPMPGAAPGLLGLAGLRGRLLAVYSLAALLSAPDGSADWLVVCGDGTLGLAFERFEGYFPLDPDSVAPMGERRHVVGVVERENEKRLILDVASLVAECGRRAAAARQEGKED